MNTEDFVTYEQALKIKKLGFKEDVNYYYENNTLTSAFESFEDPILYNIPIVVSTETLKYDFNGHDEVVISAPTLAQVQKWLYKTFKYYIIISVNYREQWCFIIKRVHYKDHFLSTEGKTCKKIGFLTPEEALSEGITECLKLLEK